MIERSTIPNFLLEKSKDFVVFFGIVLPITNGFYGKMLSMSNIFTVFNSP